MGRNLHAWVRFRSGIVVDDWLYIDGGEFWLVGDEEQSDRHCAPTLSVDLPSSWGNIVCGLKQIEKPTDISNYFHLWHEGLFLQEGTDSLHCRFRWRYLQVKFSKRRHQHLFHLANHRCGWRR